MVDLDAPSAENPIYAKWLHWIVTDIEGKQIQMGTDPSTWHDAVGMIYLV